MLAQSPVGPFRCRPIITIITYAIRVEDGIAAQRSVSAAPAPLRACG